MKKLSLILALLCVFLLVSCGSEKTPSDELIRADVAASLQEYNPSLSFTSSTVEKSISNEDNYTVTLNVQAASTYADYQLVCDAHYTKYDQGWMMDSSNWSVSGYKVVRYPSKEELEPLMLEFDDSFWSYPCVDIQCEDETITYIGERTGVSNEYVDFPAIQQITQWYYEPEGDCWTPSGENEYSLEFTLKDTLEGTWRDSEGGTYIVSNVTDTGFDLSAKTRQLMFETTHIDFNEATMNELGYKSVRYEGGVNCQIERNGEWHENGADLTISISEEYFWGLRFYISSFCQTSVISGIYAGGSLEKI